MYGIVIYDESGNTLVDSSSRNLFTVSTFTVLASSSEFTYNLPEWTRFMTIGWTLTKQTSSSDTEVPYVSVASMDGYSTLTFTSATGSCNVTVFGW